MNNKVIALFGEIGHGKDEAGQIIASYLKEQKEYVVNQRFAMRLKQFASMVFHMPLQIVDNKNYSEAVYDFTREQKATIIPHYKEKDGTDMTLGRFLQLFATETVRDGWNQDFWANCTLDHIDQEYETKDFHIITDLRFPNELDLLDKRNAITVYVERPGHDTDAKESGRDTNHSSETSLVGRQEDFIFTLLNDSTLEAYQIKCRQLAEKIYGGILNRDSLL